MFSALLERVRLEIQAISRVVQLHEFSRELFYSTHPEAQNRPGSPDPWQAARVHDPGKPAWQVYDHCAALLRLYVVYSIFVEDLVSDYLNSLPELYETYDQLPESVLKQHRTGFAQIMLKLGDSGPFRHLRESEMILQLSRNLSGVRPYTLLTDAFFVDRQNYRSEALARLFGTIGIENICSRIAKHPKMRAFLADRLGNATTFESELDRFVKLRNDAAHSSVDQVIATSEFLVTADFILLACDILAEIASREKLTHIAENRPGLDLGIVTHAYHGGTVAIIKAVPTALSVGEELALVRNGRIRITRVLSIENNDVRVHSIRTETGQEVGLGLDQKCRLGDVLRRLVQIAPAEQAALFNAEQLADVAPATSSEDGEMPEPAAPDSE